MDGDYINPRYFYLFNNIWYARTNSVSLIHLLLYCVNNNSNIKLLLINFFIYSINLSSNIEIELQLRFDKDDYREDIRNRRLNRLSMKITDVDCIGFFL